MRALWIFIIIASLCMLAQARGSCGKYSRCTNVVKWDEDNKPELIMNVEAGDKHTDGNGFCQYGFNGKQDSEGGMFFTQDTSCAADACGTTEYECKCVSQEDAIKFVDAFDKYWWGTGSLLLALMFVVLPLSCLERMKKYQPGLIGVSVSFFGCGVAFVIMGLSGDPNRYYYGCTEKGAAGSMNVNIIVMLCIAAMQVLPYGDSQKLFE
eukprot:gnl/MRDRNA2_/MRDRNA2_167776_c0_seq1.p1 gnl/MRDRNA2_/MRDRNA2_167776_c0~~gnl/MRDRNA2_/MRDRNA2_167776_c0_seq1.p1  ORF type:complete len:209 (-),score=34.63 gnl/MRDRNA2_/MRDRNA2_167776_c0_seq1:11-637(-)